MKKRLMIVTLGLISSLSMASANNKLDNNLTKSGINKDLNSTQLVELTEKVKILKNPNLKLIQARNLGNVTFVQIEAKGPGGNGKLMEAFVDNLTGSIYVGGGYDLKGFKISFPLDTTKIDNGVAFTYGTGKRNLYVVTDPKCPYCTKFFNEAEERISEDFKVNVILLALPMHPKAKVINSYIMAGKTNEEKYKRYVQMMSDKTKNKTELYKDSKVNTEYETNSSYASQELNVGGTPTFFERRGDNFKAIQWGQLVSPKKTKK